MSDAIIIPFHKSPQTQSFIAESGQSDMTKLPPASYPEDRACFVQLGKFGDLIFMLPAYKAYFDETGQKPLVIVSAQYASVLEGVSYVEPIILEVHWTKEIDVAILWATANFLDVRVVQLHGRNWCVRPDKLKSFQLSMWERAGFHGRYKELPLVLDRRDPDRELSLYKTLKRLKPMLLYNLGGETSPFMPAPEIMKELAKVRHLVNAVDISNIRCQRIYDLLGLFDRAIGLITVDTASLHLAPASKIPYIAFTRDDMQAGSIPKGNCVLHIGYRRALAHLSDIYSTVKGWIDATPIEDSVHPVTPAIR